MKTTVYKSIGGQTGIRTLETVARLHAFQACAFDHSATCPNTRWMEIPEWVEASARLNKEVCTANKSPSTTGLLVHYLARIKDLCLVQAMPALVKGLHWQTGRLNI